MFSVVGKKNVGLSSLSPAQESFAEIGQGEPKCQFCRTNEFCVGMEIADREVLRVLRWESNIKDIEPALEQFFKDDAQGYVRIPAINNLDEAQFLSELIDRHPRLASSLELLDLTEIMCYSGMESIKVLETLLDKLQAVSHLRLGRFCGPVLQENYHYLLNLPAFKVKYLEIDTISSGMAVAFHPNCEIEHLRLNRPDGLVSVNGTVKHLSVDYLCGCPKSGSKLIIKAQGLEQVYFHDLREGLVEFADELIAPECTIHIAQWWGKCHIKFPKILNIKDLIVSHYSADPDTVGSIQIASIIKGAPPPDRSGVQLSLYDFTANSIQIGTISRMLEIAGNNVSIKTLKFDPKDSKEFQLSWDFENIGAGFTYIGPDGKPRLGVLTYSFTAK